MSWSSRQDRIKKLSYAYLWLKHALMHVQRVKYSCYYCFPKLLFNLFLWHEYMTYVNQFNVSSISNILLTSIYFKNENYIIKEIIQQKTQDRQNDCTK